MTIYALSSGPGVSGVAIIRISGSEASKVIKWAMKLGTSDTKIANWLQEKYGQFINP